MEHVRNAVIRDGAFHILELRDVALKKLNGSHLLRRQQRRQARRFRVDVKNKRLVAAIHEFLDDPGADESFGARDEKSVGGMRSRTALVSLGHALALYALAKVSQLAAC